jgi:hypothetical protein
MRPLLCRFSDAGNDETLHALMRPAFEKRQGTKSSGLSRSDLVLWHKAADRMMIVEAAFGAKRTRMGTGRKPPAQRSI